MTKSLTETLKAGLPSLSSGAARVDLGAQGEQRVELAIRLEVEVRDGLLGLDEAPRDGAPHRIVRHLGVAAGLEHRLDGLVRGGWRGGVAHVRLLA